MGTTTAPETEALKWTHNEADVIKLIGLAPDSKTAKEYVEKYTPFKTTLERVEFLSRKFDIVLVGRAEHGKDYTDEMCLSDDYEALLDAVVGKKWRI